MKNMPVKKVGDKYKVISLISLNFDLMSPDFYFFITMLLIIDKLEKKW